MIFSIKRFSFLIAFFTITTVILAQHVGSNSPYSRYGYGLLVNPVPGGSEAMGGIGYGLRRSRQVNWTNPASYSRIEPRTFVFDIGASGTLARVNDGMNNRDFYNGNFDYAAMQFPLSANIGVSIGLLPFSKMGYNFGANQLESSVGYREVYRGSGGLNQLYGGIAWEPVKNVSIGANLSYLFGDFTRSSVLLDAGYVGETKYRYSIRDLKYDLGIQFTYPLDDDRSITFGAVYTPKINTKSDVKPTRMQYTADPYEYPKIEPSEVFPTDTLRSASFGLPHTVGAGLTYTTPHFLFGLDGTWQKWKNLEYPDVLDNLTKESRYNDVYRINAGLEYVIDPLSQNYFHRIRFRGGFSYVNSYGNFGVNDPNTGERMSNGKFNEYGINVGLGLPFRDYMSGYLSMLNIGFGYSRQQPNTDNMIGQDMFKISLNLNINELWFFKKQFN